LITSIHWFLPNAIDLSLKCFRTVIFGIEIAIEIEPVDIADSFDFDSDPDFDFDFDFDGFFQLSFSLS
jgi:hypothetical protein